jgi:hypothetical protein
MPTIYDFDGYEDYATAGLLREHVRVEVPGNLSIVTGGRNGGHRLKCDCTGNSLGAAGRVVRAIPELATVAFGVYMEVSSLARLLGLFQLRDATTGHVVISVNTDGSLTVARAYTLTDFSEYLNFPLYGMTTLGTSAAGVVVAGTPFHFQAKVTIADAAGAVELKVNGVIVLTLTGVDTRNGGTATVTNILHGAVAGSAGSASVYYDDFWVADDYVGDRRVDSHFPTSDGTNQDGTPSAAGAHYAMVDEAPEPDDDTSYVTLTSAGQRESYGVDDFKNTGATIDAAMIVLDAKKTDAGAATLAAHVHGAGSPADYDGTPQGLTTSYSRIKEVLSADPISGDPWDETTFNAAEFGDQKAA